MTSMTMDSHLRLVYVLVVIGLVLGIWSLVRTYESVDTSKDNVKSYTKTIGPFTDAVGPPGNVTLFPGNRFVFVENIPVGTIVLAARLTTKVGANAAAANSSYQIASSTSVPAGTYTDNELCTDTTVTITANQTNSVKVPGITNVRSPFTATNNCIALGSAHTDTNFPAGMSMTLEITLLGAKPL